MEFAIFGRKSLAYYHFIFGLSAKCQDVEKNFKENKNLTGWVVMNCALSSSSFSTDPTDKIW